MIDARNSCAVAENNHESASIELDAEVRTPGETALVLFPKSSGNHRVTSGGLRYQG